MEADILVNEKLKSSGIIILVGFCFGLIYWMFGDEWTDIVALINGVSIGVIGGIFLSFCEFFVFRIDSRKWSFINLLIIKTILYFIFFAVLILSVICFTGSIENGMGFWEYFYGQEFQHFIFEEDFIVILFYCLILLTIINFTRQINRKIGYGVLLNFIFGKYHVPREEERIFAFIDLKDSTKIAEQLGALKFHKLLYEFFHDISLAILVTKGEIYRYVGDEIVVSWKQKQGLQNANCIRTYFYMKRQLKKQREKYIEMFGFVPDFHSAYHFGKVVRGEIGDLKSQFVFHGEALFIGSKIENECSKVGCDLLISSNLIQQLSVPIIYEMKFVGALSDNEKINLYTLIEKEVASF
jgi:adenylate cyclase